MTNHKRQRPVGGLGVEYISVLHDLYRQQNFTTKPARNLVAFRRDRLLHPAEYYREQGLKLIGGGKWRSALCPFHADSQPSLRVRLGTGAFRCMACGAHGGDILAFQMQRYRLHFIEVAKALGAWEGD